MLILHLILILQLILILYLVLILYLEAYHLIYKQPGSVLVYKARNIRQLIQ